jgi:hypothetical protein
MSRLWILPVLGLIAVLGFACGDSGDDQPQSGTSSATVAPTTQKSTPILTASSTPTPTVRTAESPVGWKSFTDPLVGFTLSYPPDLIFNDLTGPGPAGGFNERVLQFRSASDQSRSFAISISANANGLTPEDWALEFTACLPETIEQGTVGGKPAIFCTALPEEIPEATVLLESSGTILHFSSIMPASEFDQVIASVRLR